MTIDIKDILTLDDNNEYIVISKVNYEKKTYYYLLDQKKTNNLKFCYEDNGDLVEIDDKELITKLIPLFAQIALNHIDN